MRFVDPWFLTLLPLVLLWIWNYKRDKSESRDYLLFSDTDLFKRLLNYKTPITAHAGFTIRILVAVLIILALARPQTGAREIDILSKGIDIMLTLDLSSSMSSTDFKPDRLTAAKQVLGKFIDGRVNDRIGLVVFSAAGYTRCPLTVDYLVLRKFMEDSNIGLIDDGTAIGMALATASNRLKDSTSKSRIIILLTDGMNNRGSIDPITAAKMAKSMDIKVYTIGVGRRGTFYQSIKGPFGETRKVPVRTEIDETLLQEIAKTTGGQYFRAENEAALFNIYREIDRMEKTEIKSRVYVRYTDWFMYFLGAALILLMVEALAPITWRRVWP